MARPLSSTVASTFLLATQYLARRPTSFPTYVLAGLTACHAANLLVVGPYTTKVMQQRAKLEREEGKAYNDEGISDKMKALNKSKACVGAPPSPTGPIEDGLLMPASFPSRLSVRHPARK